MKKKNLSNLVVLAVLLGGVSCCSSAWAAAAWYGTASGGHTDTLPSTATGMSLEVTSVDDVTGVTDFYGGYSTTGVAGGSGVGEGNSATITYNGIDAISVYGGYGTSAIGNIVTLDGNGDYQYVFGGYSNSNSGAKNNEVHISEGSYVYVTGGSASGGGEK